MLYLLLFLVGELGERSEVAEALLGGTWQGGFRQRGRMLGFPRAHVQEVGFVQGHPATDPPRELTSVSLSVRWQGSWIRALKHIWARHPIGETDENIMGDSHRQGHKHITRHTRHVTGCVPAHPASLTYPG